jgi:signal recognition particle GTPase
MPTQPDTFDPKDHKSKQTLRAEQKKERQQEALKQKTHAKELRQLIKQAAKNHKEKKRADRKHIKEIYVKLKQETKANLSKAKASHNPKEAMDEFHKQQTSDKLRNNLLVKQIKLETRTEYVKNLRQIDEAYPDLRRKQ